MDYKQVIKKLKREGWQIETGGRHLKAKKGKRRVPIPAHGSQDIKIGTLKSIEKLTGVSFTERGTKK